MTHKEIRQKFLKFFEDRGHTIIPSASLVPENDPSVLFTTAGMQPLVPYLLGQEHPAGKRLANIQKCVRTQDIDEVGDNTHDTFFEMLGNWSLGDYFKEDAIKFCYDFLTDEKEGLGLDKNKIYITVFAGSDDAPRDEESKKIWMSLGVPENRIYFLEDNWWSPGENGPCGPDTEVFYDVTDKDLGDLSHEEFLKADEDQKVVEIGNSVFMEYEKKIGKVVGKLAQRNVDFGGGLERQAMAVQGKNNIFETDLFVPMMEKLDEFNLVSNEKAKRIVADHIRTAAFMIADDVIPSNTDRGYILRRLLRRAVRYADVIGIKEGSLVELVDITLGIYKDTYSNIETQKEKIKEEIQNEEEKFRKTLEKGMRQFEKLSSKDISSKDVFVLFSTYGFPLELTLELAAEKGVSVDEEGFRKEMQKHQELSRQGSEQKFKGGLADSDEMSVKYHTATHLLHQALREVLGENVEQRGSNITSERLRFDFSHPKKMTDEEKKKIEEIVNENIKKFLDVKCEEMSVDDARASGALGVFGEKYGEKVKVYSIGNFSREICGGPHIKNIKELGVFKIKKEEAVSLGVRRIKAVLE